MWGFLFDKFDCKYLYCIVLINQLIMSGSYYFSAENKYLFFVTTCFEVISLAGHATLFPPMMGRFFLLKNSVSLLGIAGCFNAMSSLSGPILTKLIIKTTSDYIYIYYIGCGATLLAAVLFLIVRKEPFEYDEIRISKVEPILDSSNITSSNDNSTIKIEKE